MTTDKIVKNMEVIGADGVHVGTVDGVANGRIGLAKRDSGERQHVAGTVATLAQTSEAAPAGPTANGGGR